MLECCNSTCQWEENPGLGMGHGLDSDSILCTEGTWDYPSDYLKITDMKARA